MKHYLNLQGLRLLSTSSPFFVRAIGPTSSVETAFRTHVSDYQAKDGTRFFANDRTVQVPVTPDYDMATGIGTPNIYGIVATAYPPPTGGSVKRP